MTTCLLPSDDNFEFAACSLAAFAFTIFVHAFTHKQREVQQYYLLHTPTSCLKRPKRGKKLLLAHREKLPSGLKMDSIELGPPLEEKRGAGKSGPVSAGMAPFKKPKQYRHNQPTNLPSPPPKTPLLCSTLAPCYCPTQTLSLFYICFPNQAKELPTPSNQPPPPPLPNQSTIANGGGREREKRRERDEKRAHADRPTVAFLEMLNIAFLPLLPFLLFRSFEYFAEFITQQTFLMLFLFSRSLFGCG